MRILVCIDLSPLTDLVVQDASALAKATRAPRAVLHAASTEPVLGRGRVGPPQGHRVPPADIAERRTAIETVVSQLRRDALEVTGRVELSDDVVLREASATGASHILLGSHGHGRVFEMLLGSVTQAVIRDATVPVIAVPARRAAGGSTSGRA